nr:MAG TPA: stabilization protein [Bacteriophage sp.]
MRTSLDAVPTCKRIQDIAIDSIEGNVATYIDTGTNGDLVDPSSLLYIGGEEIVAANICAKDGTLFLGNIELKRPNINNIKDFAYNVKSSEVKTNTIAQELTSVSPWPYSYYNGLNTQAAGFKNREWYRIGLQAQYNNGKWSEPVFIKDYQVSTTDSYP